MTTHDVVRVEVELASSLEPISGQVRFPDADARSFSGVLELINLLDEARGQPAAPPAGPIGD
ncbi:MAG TPA: hypothetical protein VKB59_08660 [Micromonosporaceae bacterium]|nr:hypothetical protein [Micromonosporaceae bacterium]